MTAVLFPQRKNFQEVSCGVLKVCLSHIRNKFRYSENAEKRPILSKFIAFLRSGNMFFRRLRYSNRLYQISQALSRAKSRFKERLPIFRKNVKNRLQIGGLTEVSLLRQTIKTVRKDKVHKNFIICRNFQAAKSSLFFSRPTVRSRATTERCCLRKVRAPTDNDSG